MLVDAVQVTRDSTQTTPFLKVNKDSLKRFNVELLIEKCSTTSFAKHLHRDFFRNCRIEGYDLAAQKRITISRGRSRDLQVTSFVCLELILLNMNPDRPTTV